MKNANRSYKTVVITISLLVVLFGCSKKLDRYEDPPWLGGTNIETLEKDGNYTIFLQLMEKAGYRNTVEKQVTTLFAPNDEAFNAFFKKKGISSINDLTKVRAKEIFLLHYRNEPLNASHLVYEKEWQRQESDIGEYRSLFFRKQTSSYSAAYPEVPLYNASFKGQQLYISTGAKLLPLFSSLYFKDYNGDGSIDYPFMYPESKWGGLLQLHNAQVLPPKGKENTTNIEDLTNATSSGFVYYLDQVIDAAPNIDEFLIAHHDNYGLFFDLMQRFASYISRGTDPDQGVLTYTKTYSGISSLSSENGPDYSSTQPPAFLLNIFTVFLPSNEVLQTYLDNTVLKSYSSLDSVPDITIRYILQSQITHRLELKSKFTPPNIFYNYYGDQSLIDLSTVSPGYMCSNGVVYYSTHIMEPNILECVPRQLFFDKNYTTFLTLITLANLTTLISSENDVTVFAPTNNEILALNIRLTYDSRGVQIVQQKADDGQWKDMLNIAPNYELSTFIQDHIYKGKISDLSGDGYIEMISKNYVHYSNNKLTAGLNEFSGNTATIVNGSGDVRKNGILYFIDHPLQTKYRMGQYILNDPDLSEFAKLMVSTNLLNPSYLETSTQNTYPYIALIEEGGDFYWTAFIPNNAAMAKAQADGIIPTNPDDLKSFVNYHFVKKVIFDDGINGNGSIATLLSGKSVTISNNINDLRVTDASGQEVVVNHADADHLVKRGVIHKITSVLKNN